jgi:hypothetical protein
MSWEILVRLAGLGLVALALLHAAFPRRFQWREELARLSPLNREIFWIHTLFVVLTVLLMGVPMLVDPGVWLERSRPGAWAAAGFTVFWGTRLIVQFWGYSASLWRGKRFETVIHVVATVVWTLLTGLGLVLCGRQFGER